MATAEVRIDRRAVDRRLFAAVAIGVPLIVFLGYARSYYMKEVFAGPALPSALVHLHGAVMSAWIVLFAAQVWLVASRRVKLHMRLGILGSGLALAIVGVGYATAMAAAARGGAPPGMNPLGFLIIPLGDLVVFSALVGGALYYRRRLDVHKRLMLLAAVNLLAAAIARMPIGFIEQGGPFVFFGLADLCIIGCVVYDSIKYRRVHPVLLWGTLSIIAFQALRITFAGSHAWLSFAGWLVGLWT